MLGQTVGHCMNSFSSLCLQLVPLTFLSRLLPVLSSRLVILFLGVLMQVGPSHKTFLTDQSLATHSQSPLKAGGWQKSSETEDSLACTTAWGRPGDCFMRGQTDATHLH